jgi:hypothetical protein
MQSMDNRGMETVDASVVIAAGEFEFRARFEETAAPLTCAAFRRLLPFTGKLVHVRWSGEATWVPLGDLALGVPLENATTYPRPGEILFYPGPISETEILIPYGRTHFGSKAGKLAATHFLTIVGGADQLAALGHAALWNGAQTITIQQSR